MAAGLGAGGAAGLVSAQRKAAQRLGRFAQPLQTRVPRAFGCGQKLAHGFDRLIVLSHPAVKNADVIEHLRVVPKLPQPAQIRQRFRVMAGLVVDLRQQLERVGVLRIQHQRLLQRSVGGGRIAAIVHKARLAEQKLRLLAVRFAPLFRPPLFENLLAPFLVARSRHRPGCSPVLP